MDWNDAIERNREALKRVLAALAAMAGLRGRFAPEAQSCRASGMTTGGEGRDAAGGSGDPAEPWPKGPDEGQPHARPTLPRHLHRAVLRLLRPAESAVRRLVIAAAHGLKETLPRPRPRKPKPKPPTLRPGVETGIWMPPHLQPPAGRATLPARKCALPLFDPLRRPGGRKRGPSGMPRLCLPGLSAPVPVPPERKSKGRRPLAPNDRIDAARLHLRLAALGRALDDLPRQARRFARWRAHAAVPGERQASRPGRPCRLWPLKPGRPPGLPRRPEHAAHDILSDTHALALRVLDDPDTS